MFRKGAWNLGEKDWLRGVDLNHRPLGYEPNELPGCSAPQIHTISAAEVLETLGALRLGDGESFSWLFWYSLQCDLGNLSKLSAACAAGCLNGDSLANTGYVTRECRRI